MDSTVRLYCKNVLAEAIGPEHGISASQMDELAACALPAVRQVNEERKAGKTRYRDLPYDEKMVAGIKAMVKEFSPGCRNLVILGIGGSALGNIAIHTALNPCMYNIDAAQRKGPRLFVFDNVDPGQFASFLDWISPQLQETVFNVISKSGRTAETAMQFLIIRDMLLKALGPRGYTKHVLATTDAKSGTLRTIADKEGLRTLEVPDGVGGRFSVLSAVGLFSAAMTGIDIDALLAGARDMDQRCKSEDVRRNPAAMNAAVNWHYYNRGKPISVMMSYSHALIDFADWYRQLWAESLGKARDLKGREVFVGPTPVKALGTTDQHSQVQLYREGPNDKLFTFLEVRKFPRDVTSGPAPECAHELDDLAGRRMSELFMAEKLGTEYALLKSNRPCLSVIIDEITPQAIGQFIYLYEVTTSIAGVLFGIDPYDQPAVELGKDATLALMGVKSYERLAAEIRPLAN
ncbi:MAG TPA: glucose-6-phosphate isomerase, partial [Sedimentisphaerales bacterium]|nr:glucose-6-phosphate isomerase [Sedimentisphaerales bacterium]